MSIHVRVQIVLRFFFSIVQFFSAKRRRKHNENSLSCVYQHVQVRLTYIKTVNINHYDEFIPSRLSRILGPHLLQNLNHTITQTFYFIL